MSSGDFQEGGRGSLAKEIDGSKDQISSVRIYVDTILNDGAVTK